MPVYVDVWINDRAISTYAIGRIAGGAEPDDVNVYAVMEMPGRIERPFNWDMTVQFEHRYGDGVDVCIRKALGALAGHRLKNEQTSKCDHRSLNTHALLDEIGGFWTELNTYCPKCGQEL